MDEYGRSPFWYHAANGDLAALKADLRSGTSPTSPDKDGYTALHVAIQNGHAEVVALLIGAGADPNAIDRHGNGPLWTAGYEGSKAVATPVQHSVITMLLRAGANPHQENKAGRSPQMWREICPDVDAAFREAGY